MTERGKTTQEVVDGIAREDLVHARDTASRRGAMPSMAGNLS